MQNILYLDDFINYYSIKLQKTIIIKPYKDTIHNGRLINKEKFIKSFLKLKDNYKLNNSIFNEDIIVIINSFVKKIDKQLLKNILEELNYKNIKFINEIEIININKKIMFINFNYSYFSIYCIENNKTQSNIYENNLVNKNLLLNIIKYWSKREIIFTGKNYKELLNILEKSEYNYYYFEENENLYINKLLKNKMYN